jgi:hypothetical protein
MDLLKCRSLFAIKLGPSPPPPKLQRNDQPPTHLFPRIIQVVVVFWVVIWIILGTTNALEGETGEALIFYSFPSA